MTKRKAGLLAVLALLLCSGGIAAAIAIARSDASKRLLTSLAPPSITRDEAPRIIWAWNFEDTGREIFAVIEISEAEARGKIHRRLTIENGRITKAERIDPSGLVQATTTARYAADGSWERTEVNGYGTFVDVYRFSSDGVRTQEDRSGSPFSRGCVRIAYKLTPAGDPFERTCQDADGRVIVDLRGCEVRAQDHDEHHRMIAQRCLSRGAPVLNNEGVHEYRMRFDDAGRLLETSNWGLDGKPVADTSDCASTRLEYDVAGNETANGCFGLAGSRVAFRGTSIATFRQSFDEHGCEVRNDYLDIDGQPTVLRGKIAAIAFTVDRHCTVLSRELQDASGNLVSRPTEVARTENIIDARGDVTQTSCFDTTRSPASCTGQAGVLSASIKRYQYDDHGRAISQKAFDGSGRPSESANDYPHETRVRYDERGWVLEERYFDPDGKPSVALGNVAWVALGHDALGREVSLKSFGVDNAPVRDTTGSHEVRREYDDRRRVTRIALFDEQGNASASANLVLMGVDWPSRSARVDIVREEPRTFNRFFDEDGKEVATVDCTDRAKDCHR